MWSMPRPLRNGAAWLGRGVLQVLLPSHCLTCDSPVSGVGQLCADCFKRTNFLGEPCCNACGRGFNAEEAAGRDRLCTICQAEPPGWGAARAAFRYDEQSKKMLMPLKYNDKPEYARALGIFMARAGAGLVRDADWLVPVPLHRARLRSRRYNQAALLATAVGRAGRKPTILDAIRRTRATRPLATWSAGQRVLELAGVFAVNPARLAQLRDSRVLLIDDVLTSGSTAEACTRVLLDAGVIRVDVLAAARAADPQFA